MTDLIQSRRNLLRASLGGAAGLLLGGAGSALAGDPTVAQVEGPFHPMPQRRNADGDLVTVDQRLISTVDRDSDLTFVSDAPGTAIGTQAIVTGIVRDENDRPLPNAEVEIWQACVSGRYNHKSDPSQEWLDPEFQYWGRATSDASGRYTFRTVVPGAYRANGSWIRPPHIHYKVSRRGFRDLTTQMYFSGVTFYYGNRFWPADVLRQLNERDQILRSIRADLRPSVIAVGRDPRPGEGLEADMKVFNFDITLEAVPQVATPAASDPRLLDLLSR